VFENGVLRKIFGPRREEVAGDWRRLHKEELHNSYASPNIIRMIRSRRMRWARHVVCIEIEKCIQNLVRQPEGKRALGRPTRRWEDNIRTDVREIVWEGVHWIHLAQDRGQWRDVVSTVMNLRVP
jgi:hypothetical protein